MINQTDEALALQIRDLRQYLLDSGYAHTSRPGELAGYGANGVGIHVRTGYTHGSYRLMTFGYINGTKQGAHFIDINRGASDDRVKELKFALADWDGQVWPPHPDMASCSTGRGDGWPPQ